MGNKELHFDFFNLSPDFCVNIYIWKTEVFQIPSVLAPPPEMAQGWLPANGAEAVLRLLPPRSTASTACCYHLSFARNVQGQSFPFS